MFENLLEEILRFAKTGVSPIPREETLETAALLGASVAAMTRPGEWVNV